MTAFAQAQADYAAHGVPLFPVRIVQGQKRPAVRGYLKIGLTRSEQLARQFPDAPTFGYACGQRSGVTVLDIDTADEKIVADAFDRHGKTPIIVRSGGGHFQGWYRYNGERRSIRPNKDLPIDYLGGGYVVAPPSQGSTSRYQFIAGGLEDLQRLPPIGGLPQRILTQAQPAAPITWGMMGPGSGRNNALFRQLGREAHCCDDFDQLLDRARTLNADFATPMEASRVVSVARSVWTMTTQGRNRFGQHGAYFPVADVDRLADDPFLLTLLAWLRAHNGPDSIFMVADGLVDVLRWPRRLFVAARRAARAGGWIVMVTPPSKGRAARYRWSRGREEEAFVEDLLPRSAGLEFGSSGDGLAGLAGQDMVTA